MSYVLHCFTSFKLFEPSQYETICAEYDAYIGVGIEVCPTTNRSHHQGFIYRKSKFSLKQLTKLLEGAHIEPCKGSLYSNKVYCSKEDNYTEYGISNKPSQDGKRKDIPEILLRIREGATTQTLVEENLITNCQALRYAEGLRKYTLKPYEGERNVHFFYGDSGTGKTKQAYKLYPDIVSCRLERDGKLTGYNGEESVLIDDLEDLSITQFKELLRLTDRYKWNARVLGDTIPWRAKNVVLTCDRKIEDICPPRQNPQQIIRRVTDLKLFSKTY